MTGAVPTTSDTARVAAANAAARFVYRSSMDRAEETARDAAVDAWVHVSEALSGVDITAPLADDVKMITTLSTEVCVEHTPEVMSRLRAKRTTRADGVHWTHWSLDPPEIVR